MIEMIVVRNWSGHHDSWLMIKHTSISRYSYPFCSTHLHGTNIVLHGGHHDQLTDRDRKHLETENSFFTVSAVDPCWSLNPPLWEKCASFGLTESNIWSEIYLIVVTYFLSMTDAFGPSYSMLKFLLVSQRSDATGLEGGRGWEMCSTLYVKKAGSCFV